MPGRIDVDPSLPSAEVSPRVLNEIASHAREALPEECCGLISGDAGTRFRRVHRCRNEMTRMHELDPLRHPRDGRQAFHMNERDTLDAIQQARAAGHEITAVYHSHPGLGAYFSELDQAHAAQELFPFPDADHIVVSIRDGRVEAALFQRGPAGFVGRRLEAGRS